MADVTNRLLLKVGLTFSQTEELKNFNKEFTAFKSKIQDLDLAKTMGFKNVAKDVDTANKGIQKTGGFVSELGTKLRSQAKNFAIFSLLSGSVLFLTTQMRNAVSVVSELDKSYTNFAIVTGATAEQISEMDSQANKLTETLGRLKKEVIDSITEFSRAGYALDESITLAKNSIIGANVGFTDLANVTKFVIAGLKSFKLEAEDSAKLIDVLFQVSNKTAIDFEGIGEAFLRSANTLQVAGASLEETTALISAANESIQDASKVGTALKTIAARLRGVGDEGEAIPSLARDFKAVGIELQNADGSFRNIYDVFRDFAAVYKDLDDLTKQSLVEKIAGKRQANIFIGLIENWDVAEMALTEGLNSVGSAAEANEKFLASVEGRVNTLKNAINDLYQSFVDSTFLKAFISLLTVLVKTLDFLTQKIPGIVTGIGLIALSFKALIPVLASVAFGAQIAFTAFGFWLPVIGLVAGAFISLNGVLDLTSSKTEIVTEKTVELADAHAKLKQQIEESSLASKKARAEELEAILKEIDALEKARELRDDQYSGNFSDQIKAATNATENYSEQIDNLIRQLGNYGFTVDEARAFVDELALATEGLTDEQIKLADQLGITKSLLIDSSENQQLLADAMYEATTQGYLSDAILQKMKETFPEFVSATGLAKDKIIEFAKAQSQASEEGIKAQIAELTATKVATQARIDAYQDEIDKLVQLAQVKQIGGYGIGYRIQDLMNAAKSEVSDITNIDNAIAELNNELGQFSGIQSDLTKRINDYNDKNTKTVEILTEEEKAVRDLSQAIALKERELKRAEGEEEQIAINKELIELNKQLKTALIAQKDAYMDANKSLKDGTPEYDDYIENLYKLSLQIEDTTNATIDYIREQRRLNAEIAKNRLKTSLESQLKLGQESIKQSLELARSEKKRLENEYDLAKKNLDLKKEEYDFNKKLSELNQDLSDAELEKQMLLTDNSLESQRRRAELGEQISELQKSKEELIQEESFKQQERDLDNHYNNLIQAQDDLIDELERNLKDVEEATDETLSKLAEIADTQSEEIGKILASFILGLSSEVGDLGGAWDTTTGKLQAYLALLSSVGVQLDALPTQTTPTTGTDSKGRPASGVGSNQWLYLQNLLENGTAEQKKWAQAELDAGRYDNGGKLEMGSIAYNKEQTDEWVLTDKNLMNIFERGLSAITTPKLDIGATNNNGIDTLINIENMNNTLSSDVDVSNMGKNLAKGASNTLISRGITI